MKYALDTNIITYYLKGNEKIQDKVDKEAECENIFKNAISYIDNSHSRNIEERVHIIKKSGIKTADAFHISCAIEGECACLITTDKLLLKYKSDKITICDPVQFIDYLEEKHA